ncbi:hypothetical protein BTJ39_21430 [Izhakiella australiensis]|uniref:Uncharacterized protein n=2 Tax=Izhakiella australiensis TaxID=1926881 RepID=A0A1S8YCT9_9GAMM|nr:hypothetical protein BTJ39_21430 [Izhakiella australiensis]
MMMSADKINPLAEKTGVCVLTEIRQRSYATTTIWSLESVTGMLSENLRLFPPHDASNKVIGRVIRAASQKQATQRDRRMALFYPLVVH